MQMIYNLFLVHEGAKDLQLQPHKTSSQSKAATAVSPGNVSLPNGPVPLNTSELVTSKSSTSTVEVANAAKSKPEAGDAPSKASLKTVLLKEESKPIANGVVNNSNAAPPPPPVQAVAGAARSPATPSTADSKPQTAAAAPASAAAAKSIRVSFSDSGEPRHTRASESTPYPIVTEATESTATANKKPEQKKSKRTNKLQRDALKTAPASAAAASPATSRHNPAASAAPASAPAPSPVPPLVNGFAHGPETESAAGQVLVPPEPLEDASSLVDEVDVSLTTDPCVVSAVVKSTAGAAAVDTSEAERKAHAEQQQLAALLDLGESLLLVKSQLQLRLQLL